jgi:hypothetical protein
MTSPQTSSSACTNRRMSANDRSSVIGKSIDKSRSPRECANGATFSRGRSVAKVTIFGQLRRRVQCSCRPQSRATCSGSDSTPIAMHRVLASRRDGGHLHPRRSCGLISAQRDGVPGEVSRHWLRHSHARPRARARRADSPAAVIDLGDVARPPRQGAPCCAA